MRPGQRVTTTATTELGDATDQVGNAAFVRWASAADFSAGVFDGTAISDDGLVMGIGSTTADYLDPFGDGTTTTYDVATWTSPEIEPGFEVTGLVASWNARTPDGSWIEVSTSGVADDGQDAKEYVLGRWSEDTSTIHRTTVGAQGDELASIDADELIARPGRSLTTYRLIARLYRRRGSVGTPSVRLLGVIATRPAARPTRAEPSPCGGAWGMVLDVPAYSQELHRGEYPEYSGGGAAWCSPTSTCMVMSSWGRLPPPADYAWVEPSYADPWVDFAVAATYDWSYQGAGNWAFNTAFAARYGLEAFVTRLRSLTEAERFIAAGIPLVVSVSFGRDELDDIEYDSDGHLMVLVGLTSVGDVVVNDPASRLVASNEGVRRVFDRLQFENVWVPRSGGLVYVIRPDDVPLPPPPPEPNW